jgi:hypothetical protein
VADLEKIFSGGINLTGGTCVVNPQILYIFLQNSKGFVKFEWAALLGSAPVDSGVTTMDTLENQAVPVGRKYCQSRRFKRQLARRRDYARRRGGGVEPSWRGAHCIPSLEALLAGFTATQPGIPAQPQFLKATCQYDYDYEDEARSCPPASRPTGRQPWNLEPPNWARRVG